MLHTKKVPKINPESSRHAYHILAVQSLELQMTLSEHKMNYYKKNRNTETIVNKCLTKVRFMSLMSKRHKSPISLLYNLGSWW